MTRTRLLIALAALAGWVDALSFLHLGKVFTSFQSGTLIFLGLAVPAGDGGLLVRAVVSLAAFVAGAALGSYFIGRAVVHQPRSLFPAFALEAALLLAFAAFWQGISDPAAHPAGRLALIALAASAMGAQGAAVLALRIPGVITNAMTATLNLAGALLGLRAHGSDATRGASPLPPGVLVALCASYVASAVAVGAAGRPDVAAVVPGTALVIGLAVTLRMSARRAVVAG